MAFTWWQIIIAVGTVLLVGIGGAIVVALLGWDDEEHSVMTRSPDQRVDELLAARYGQDRDPLLRDHAATSLVIRSSERGRR